MALASVTKTPAYFSRFQVKLRRRREGKTDYQQRTRLVKQELDKYQTKKNRFIVRITNSRIICQVAYSNIAGDVIVCSADSSELANFGMPVGLTNYPAAYATGLLCARRCLKKLGMDSIISGKVNADGEEYQVIDEDLERTPFTAVFDVGLARTTTGAKIFGALKGAVDGGIHIPHSSKRFPGYKKDESETSKDSYDAEFHRSRIFGKHVADYMKKLQEEDRHKFESHFSRYVKQGITADNLEQKIKNVHEAIRANPDRKIVSKTASYKYLREGNYVNIVKDDGSQVRVFRPQKLNAAERAARVQKKIEEVARIAAAAMED